MLSRTILMRLFFCLIATGCFVSTSYAQRGEEESAGIQIERIAISLRAPQEFHIPLKLRPAKSLHLVAQMDGAVNKIYFKAGDQVAAQTELIRFDSQERSIQLQIAQAEHALAQAEAKLAKGPEKAVADAKVKVARKKLDFAEFRDQQTIVLAPISGVLSEVNVVEGEYVRAGDLLAVVYEPQLLIAEVPVERGKVEPGATFSLQVEADVAEAKVDAILQPLESFDPLRELFVSVATAKLLVDSPDGKFQPGQGISSEMVPTHPVTEIPIESIQTDDENADSERMVQVIRDGFVRNLPIQMLGQVGQTHVFVSGRFTAADELIVSSSEDLLDGSWVRPMMVDEELASPTGRRTRSTTGRQSGTGSVLGPDGIRRPLYNKNSD